MNASLRLALTRVSPQRIIAVVLADMPFLSPDLVEATLDACAAGADVAYPIVAGQAGHPVAFGPRTRSLLDDLPDGDSIRSVRDAPQLVRRPVAWDQKSILCDIDTPLDLVTANEASVGAR